MSKATITPADDWQTKDIFLEQSKIFNKSTLNYQLRSEVRRETGFGSCVSYISPRVLLISPSRVIAWVNKRAVQQTEQAT